MPGEEIYQHMEFSKFREVFNRMIFEEGKVQDASGVLQSYMSEYKGTDPAAKFFLHWHAFQLHLMSNNEEEARKHRGEIEKIKLTSEDYKKMTFKEIMNTPGYGLSGIMGFLSGPEEALAILENYIAEHNTASSLGVAEDEVKETLFFLHAQAIQLCLKLKDDKKMRQYREGLQAFVPSDDEYKKMTFGKFEQTPGYGLRGFVETSDGSMQHLEEELRVQELYIVHQNQQKDKSKSLGVEDSKIKSSMISLHWHAFQLCAKLDKQSELFRHKQALNALIDPQYMSAQERKALLDLYGPAYKPYFEASMAFLSKDQGTLKAKFAEVLEFPIEDYPDSNVRYIPGRVHDMLENPDCTYDVVLQKPRTLPPLQGQDDWYVVDDNMSDKEGIDYYINMKSKVLQEDSGNSNSAIKNLSSFLESSDQITVNSKSDIQQSIIHSRQHLMTGPLQDHIVEKSPNKSTIEHGLNRKGPK